jgi:hypothetical protein
MEMLRVWPLLGRDIESIAFLGSGWGSIDEQQKTTRP